MQRLVTNTDPIILWLNSRPSLSERNLIGPKAASLCTLHKLGLKVPPGFVLTTTAFRAYLDANDLSPRIVACLEQTPVAMEEIRRIVTDASLPSSLREQIAAAYDRLGATVVAVRSSATAEDLPGHSFAGQYETILGVKSLEECLNAIKRCWASLWTERAHEYRRRNGIDHQQVRMAIIVQQQIEPEAAGVAFSIDPVTGSPSRIVIESCRGLGEALVSGRVQPDRIILRKKNLELGRQDLVGEEPSLDLKSARQLARRVRHIEKRLGCPQDVEWAIRHGALWFLQARPITAIPEPKSWEDRQVWTNLNVGEVAPDVMTPVTWSMIRSVFLPFFQSFFDLFGADISRSPVVGLVGGRIYFNINTGLAAARPFVSPARLTVMNNVFGGEQNRSFELGEFDICEEDLPDLGFSWLRYILSWPRLAYALLTHSPARGDQARARLHVCSEALRRLDLDRTNTADLAATILMGLRGILHDANLFYLATGAPALLVFERACRCWLRDQGPQLAYRLMAAQGGMADTEAGLDMWRLAELAHRDTEIESLLLADDSWSDARQKLARTEPGRCFLDAWARFMDEHGHHCRGELEFFNARWSERPDYILGLVRNYLGSIGSVDPVENHGRLAQEREELIAQCRRRLRNPIRRALFNWSLNGAGKLAVDRENWKNEVIRLLTALRRIFLVLGTRFREAGVLAGNDDIFFLELSEIESLAQGRPNPGIAGRIAARRAEYERNQAVTPPPVVVGRFDPQKYVALGIDTTVRELKGIAVSPGVVTGKARVILRADDHQQVAAGEILVAPFTDPAWTPYFLPAAGVVMDMGGVLSHGAIIAREYGIPAVVNVGPASKIIQTGQTIRVDADRGVVTILDEA
jgi:phosphohistidine swiveling domain-containing protein